MLKVTELAQRISEDPGLVHRRLPRTGRLQLRAGALASHRSGPQTHPPGGIVKSPWGDTWFVLRPADGLQGRRRAVIRGAEALEKD